MTVRRLIVLGTLVVLVGIVSCISLGFVILPKLLTPQVTYVCADGHSQSTPCSSDQGNSNSSNTSGTNTNPSSTTSSSTSSGTCPDANKVATLTHENVSNLSPLSGCGYKFRDGFLRDITCPGQFEAAVEATASDGSSVIYYCAKGDSRTLNIYGASLWIGADPCTIAAQHNGATHVDGKSC